MSNNTRGGTFKSMGLMDEVVRSIDKLGFRHPTPIQRKAVPAILTGVDCVAMARTGSGKTAAFAIPTVNRLAKHSEVVGARAIVLSPTRELAMQTCKVFQLLARYTDLRVALIVGGHSMEGQFDRLMNNPDIIIATPGRLIHHLEQEGNFTLDRVEMLIMDEADRLFELGFSEQIERLLKSCPSNRQALLFSATLPSQLVRFAKAGLQNPEFVRLDSECSLSEDLEIYMAFTRSEAKPAALISVLRSLRSIQDDPKSLKKTIVFVATRHHVDFLGQLVSKSNVAKCALIYGSMEQQLRSNSLAQFRSGQASVLIVTDVAARGIDIPDVDNVIHYDFPCSPKLFIHRSGRTARAGRSGLCIAVVTAGDMPYLEDLVMFVDATLELSGTQKKSNPVAEDDMVVEIDESGEQVNTSARAIEIGGIPLIDEDMEMVDRMLADDTDLQSGKKSMDFSMGPYFKTRPSASKQAVRQAREFVESKCGGQQRLLSAPLTLFKSLLSVGGTSVVTAVDESSREDILNSLRAFRPSQSAHQHSTSAVGAIVKNETRKALQDQLYGSRRARDLAKQLLEASNNPADFSDIGDSLESEDEASVPAEPVKIKKKTDFRSKQFFHVVNNVPTAQESARDKGFELEQHRMDLVPETNEEMSKVRYGKKWDSRKMNYVTVRIGSDGKAIKEKRNESGKKMTKKDLEKGKSLYKEWSKKTKKVIQKTGEVESEAVAKAGKRQRTHDGVDEKHSKKSAAFFEKPRAVSSKQYHGDVPWDYLTNKQKRLETRKLRSGAVTSRGNENKADTLKTPQSIAKARQLKSTRQVLQNPKKRKDFHKQSKESYMKKQDVKIKGKSAPGRSWAKGQKPLGRR